MTQETPLLPLDAADKDAEELATRVYLAVLQHSEPSRSLLVAQGMHAHLVDRSLSLLQERGLLRVGTGGQVEVIPPDISLPALALTYERQARSTRSAAHELAQVFFQARSSSGGPDAAAVRVLTSMDEIAAVTAEAVASGTEVVRAFRSFSPRTEAIFAAPTHSHEEPTHGAGGKLLETRTVYDTQVLELDGALAVLQARERGGETFRFTSSVPFSAVIIDEAAAIVDVTSFDPTGFGSALLRARPMVLALTALFDQLWNLGSPLHRAGSGAAAERRDHMILSLLAAGAPDATIARQTGVSQRTVERRVRALMDRLGAGTRFQAGVQAARRGLV
ncbi:helix-turn-helix transcriptional regulator [Pedococcus sp. 5OH_020]|uniref:helix-turn-helix transcriptional regulator n=1 Tax=Pedococcus sp. 5OH_020 TaxID=2989814 RepID=UPI0022E999DB|nr:helix-turn-helix transcriptional regulator [Pedococcus sp. 5OH_020]